MSGRPSLSAIDYLFGLEHIGIKFGLENIRAIVDALGHPESAFRSLHVAGTNGKGSITAMAERALRAAAYRTGRFTSPHLVRVNERFAIDGRAVDDDMLEGALNATREAITGLIARGSLASQPTFFEVTTAAAFELFRRARVDIAVVEVGLGGRLDATNVLHPMATAIASIGFDHEQYLGEALPQIAREKAGIVKPGVPVVLGKMSAEAREAIEEIARERGAEIVRAGDDVPASYAGVRLGLRGAHQAANAAVAIALLEVAGAKGLAISHDAIATGLADVEWPGRLDLRTLPDGRELLLDAAHNRDGASALARFLCEWGPPKPALMFGAMRDKDIDGMLRVLLPHAELLVATAASNPRSADPAAIADLARSIAPELPMVVEPAPVRALAAAWNRHRRVVVAGSIFLLGDVLTEWNDAS
jgi:dihydrofolate synthase / folylpolyglutamate synthase